MYIQILYQKLNNIPSILGLTVIGNCKLVMTNESFRNILVDTQNNRVVSQIPQEAVGLKMTV